MSLSDVRQFVVSLGEDLQTNQELQRLHAIQTHLRRLHDTRRQQKQQLQYSISGSILILVLFILLFHH